MGISRTPGRGCQTPCAQAVASRLFHAAGLCYASVMRSILWAFVLLAATSGWPPGGAYPSARGAQPGEEASEPVRAEVRFPLAPLPPRGEAVVSVVLEIAPGVHVMADRGAWGERDDFRPFPVRLLLLEVPPGVIAEAPLYPAAEPLSVGFTERPLPTFAGRSTIHLPLRLELPSDAEAVRLRLRLEFQACTENACLLPEHRELEAHAAVAAPGESPQAADPGLLADYTARRAAAAEAAFELLGIGFRLDGRTAFGTAGILLLGALGGLLLNLTPCVLPLIPVKVLSLSRAAADPRRCRRLGLFILAGVASFWLALGLAVATASGIASAHGLFQIPAFALAVGLVLAGLAAGGLGGWSPRLPGFLYRFEPRFDSAPGAFGVGVLTAVLSTPCTAPFMGTAAAWAASRSPETAVLAFLAIGLGMGAPYALLAALPHQVGRLRTAGPATELVRQTMSVLLLAAACYVAGVGVQGLLPEMVPPRAWRFPVAACLAAAGLWVAWRGPRLAARRAARSLWAGGGLVFAAAVAVAVLAPAAPDPIAWEPFGEERLARAQAAGQAVALVFSAEWCLNCRVLEETVWKRPEIARRLSAPEVVALRADLTTGDPAARRMLRRAGSLTVPFLVIYGKDGAPLWKGDFYTAEQVAVLLDRARAGP